MSDTITKEQAVQLARVVDYYYMEYRRKDYTLADAFKPQPNWGRRRFSVPANTVGISTDRELIAAARDTAPDEYELVRLWEVGGGVERNIYVKSWPLRQTTIESLKAKP